MRRARIFNKANEDPPVGAANKFHRGLLDWPKPIADLYPIERNQEPVAPLTSLRLMD